MAWNSLRTNAFVGSLIAVLVFLSSAHAAQNTKPPAPRVVRKTNAALQASAINRVEPIYPQPAIDARVSGTVLVEVSIDENGVVTSARALSGHPLLREAAVDAARGWTFKPTMLQGKPVKATGSLALTFRLPDHILRDRALDRLKAQVAANPRNPRLHYQLGLGYEAGEQFEDALREYAQAVELKGDYADALVALGNLNMKLNRYDAALGAFKRAVLLNLAPDKKAAANRAMALIYFRREQFELAVEPFKQAIAVAPQGSLYLNLGLTFLKLGDKESAMDQYRQLKEVNSILAEQLLKQINEAP